MDVLILGGTTYARQLAEILISQGISATTSLAGRTAQARRPPGNVRFGGFGGTAGLISWLTENKPSCVVDATHSFAATISDHCAQACQELHMPVARLEPASWRALPQSPGWTWVADNESACQAANNFSDPIFLTVGRQSTADFLPLADRFVVHRVINPPAELPSQWELITTRGPFSYQSEKELMLRKNFRLLITKDSGGLSMKLAVATELNISTIMISRPLAPNYKFIFHSPSEIISWINALHSIK